MAKNIVLGDEYDDALKQRVVDTLKSMGATPLSKDWAMVGSQELDSLTVQLRAETIVIEAETYIGLSIAGPDALVDEIAARVKA